MSTEAPRRSRIARGTIAGVAVARAGLARAGHRLAGSPAPQAHEAELGRILFGALNQLKGVALKASQLLASEPGLLPDALREQLARANYQATPMNRALVHKAMRQALGPDWDARFAEFDDRAFAAASLGQVHRAQLADGRELAVKLQYPGIAATVKSDMRMLRSLLGVLPLERRLLEPLFDEIEANLRDELDYRREAAELRWFATALPGLRIPQPLAELSTAELLCMDALPGLHLNEWLATGPSQAQRDAAGQRIFDAFVRMVFELGRLHADPHPGNYLFDEEGGVALLDFGCTRSLPEPLCAGVARAWSAHLRGAAGVAELHGAYAGLGLIAPGLSLDGFAAELLPILQPLLDWQVAPFRAARFDFGSRAPLPRMGAEQQRMARQCLHSLPAELPFFDRSWMGLNRLLAQLGARVQTTNPWIQQ